MLPDAGGALFELRHQQETPRNVFVPLAVVQRQLDQEGRVNALLLGSRRTGDMSPEKSPREALEAYAIEQAIDRAESGDLEVLEEKLKNHEHYMPAHYNKKKTALEAEFHLQIAAIAKNKVLETLLRVNFEHLYLRFDLDSVDPKRMPIAVQEHYDIVDKIKKKDISGAVEALRLHVRKGRNVIVAGISKEEEPSR